MAQLLPPPPPTAIVTGDDERRERLQFRIWQVFMATLTVMVAVWLTSYGKPLVMILAWVVAKHILVAIFMMGLHRYPTSRDDAT